MPSNCSNLAAAVLVLSTIGAFAGEPPSILSRDSWQAKPPSLSMHSQKPMAILVHHTGEKMKTNTPLSAKMKNLQRFSQAREKLSDGRTKPAWPDVPYHFYIAADGKIAEGRDILAVGDTNTGYDPAGFVQVAVEGNFDTETMTETQALSLKAVLQWLTEKYDIKSSAIMMHRDKAQTACPGKNLAARLPEIIATLK
jgi:N-acetylmuramoyl-L-alanine amidase